MKKALLLLLLALGFTFQGIACTTAVISGKYTKDGKPMLWKNRDTGYLNNFLDFNSEGKYSYVGLVNSKDLKKTSIWIGINSVGFGIMNSASYNMNLSIDAPLTGKEGITMRQALMSCKTLADFEAFLDAIPKPSGLEANFGVIDAEGGAAYYEFNHTGYVKFDANDPRVAPYGYIIRSNYSYTGKLGKESSGYIRSNTVNELFYEKAATTGLTAQFIQQNVAKGLKHSLMNEDLFDKYGNLPPNHPQYAHFRDYIPRKGSSSSVVVEGVMKGQNPEFAVLWSNVGFPLASMMTPTWVAGGKELPKIVQLNAGLKDSPICYAALKLKKEKIMNIRWGKWAQYYIDVNALANNQGTGITQLLNKYEQEIYKKTCKYMKQWNQEGKPNKKEIKAFYQWLDIYITEIYSKEFDIKL
jgi:hypothetical protein